MIEKAGVLYFRFFCYLYVLFSFVLIQKKKYQKEKIKAASALRSHPRLKGRNSLRSNSLPFLTPGMKPPLDAVQTRPGGHAAWSAMQCRVLCGVIVYYVAL